jgi:hypothetical protein
MPSRVSISTGIAATLRTWLPRSATLRVAWRREQAAREELVKQWAQFTPADKAHCLRLSTLAGDPTYTELITCLEIEREVRKVREKESGTSWQAR